MLPPMPMPSVEQGDNREDRLPPEAADGEAEILHTQVYLHRTRRLQSRASACCARPMRRDLGLMNSHLRASRRVALVVAAVLALAAAASFAQVKVIIWAASGPPTAELLPGFEKTGTTVTTTSGGYVGSGPNTIGGQLRSGIPADVVILAREGLGGAHHRGPDCPGTDVDLARSVIGMVVRAGAPKPDIRTVDGFKQALVRAKSVAMSSSTSGVYLTTKLFPRLGIAEEMAKKSLSTGAAAVGRGEAEIGLQQVSELLPIEGVTFVGTIPEEIQYVTTYAAGIVAGSQQIDAARRLIAYLSAEPPIPRSRRVEWSRCGKSSHRLSFYSGLRDRRLVERQELGPGAVCVRLVVDWCPAARACPTCTSHAATSCRPRLRPAPSPSANASVSLSFASGCRWSSFAATAEVHPPSIFGASRCGLSGCRHQSAAVERCARPDAIGHRRRRSHDQRAAHAVALRADLLRPFTCGCASSHATNAAASFSAAPRRVIDPISGVSFARSAGRKLKFARLDAGSPSRRGSTGWERARIALGGEALAHLAH